MALRLAIFTALVAVLAGGCRRSPEPPPTEPTPPTVPGARRITTVTENGGRVSWSYRLDRIAFDRLGEDEYYDVYTMHPDGSNVTCLTCDRPGLPTRHNGNPAWRPDGTFIVFQAQKQDVTGPLIDVFAKPGSGINNDLWIVDTAGRGAWRLTDVPVGRGGVLHPHFSHRGDRLLWSERIGPGGRFGEWAIKLADFRIEGGVPRIENTRTYQPGAQRRFYETHGFSLDDQQIYFSGNPEPGQDEVHLDIYRMDIQTGALVNLTPAPGVWDEHAQLSPSGNRILWMSSRGVIEPSEPLNLRTDFWLMNADGSGQMRLTYFNESGRAEFISGGAVAADSDWSPDGSRIIAYVILDNLRQTGRIVMIEVSSPQVSAPPGWPVDILRSGIASSQAIARDARQQTPARGRPIDAGEANSGDPLLAIPRTRDQLPGRDDRPAQLRRNGMAASGELLLVIPRTSDELASWDARLAQMSHDGQLELAEILTDTVLRGRWHERYAQTHRGVPVFGAGASRQIDGRRTVSLFGALYRGINIDTAPALSPDEAREKLERLTGIALGSSDRLQLTILPRDDGNFALTYAARVASPTGIIAHFLDARTGEVVWRIDDLRAQAPVGRGLSAPPPGANDVQTIRLGGRALTLDASRQPGILTFDMRGDLAATLGALNGTRSLSWSDLGEADPASSDDTAVMDAHRHAAWTYDYLLDRFGQRGIGRSVRVVSLLHPLVGAGYPAAVEALFGRSAFYAGNGMIVYGDGAAGPQRQGDPVPLSRGLDIVAHEIAHGILDFSSRLVYRGESGALQEAFADIIATSVENERLRLDNDRGDREYVVGEAVAAGGLRSLQTPQRFGQADHYNARVPHTDHRALYINAGIPAHAFYLAIEGGAHASSGVRIEGVGAGRREQIERAVFRALVWMLPSSATFAMARAATLQAARDLYGSGSPAELALVNAWTAVGVH